MARCYDYAECFQDAPAGSLWCDHCRARRALEHEQRAATRTAVIEESTARYNAENQAASLELCARCRKVPVPKRELEDQAVEQLRRHIQQQLLTGRVTIDSGKPLSRFDAYCRAIELTAPHRLQRYKPLCESCRTAGMADWAVFLSDGP